MPDDHDEGLTSEESGAEEFSFGANALEDVRPTTTASHDALASAQSSSAGTSYGGADTDQPPSGVVASFIHRFRNAEPRPPHERAAAAATAKQAFWWKVGGGAKGDKVEPALSGSSSEADTEHGAAVRRGSLAAFKARRQGQLAACQGPRGRARDTYYNGPPEDEDDNEDGSEDDDIPGSHLAGLARGPLSEDSLEDSEDSSLPSSSSGRGMPLSPSSSDSEHGGGTSAGRGGGLTQSMELDVRASALLRFSDALLGASGGPTKPGAGPRLAGGSGLLVAAGGGGGVWGAPQPPPSPDFEPRYAQVVGVAAAGELPAGLGAEALLCDDVTTHIEAVRHGVMNMSLEEPHLFAHRFGPATRRAAKPLDPSPSLGLPSLAALSGTGSSRSFDSLDSLSLGLPSLAALSGTGSSRSFDSPHTRCEPREGEELRGAGATRRGPAGAEGMLQGAEPGGGHGGLEPSRGAGAGASHLSPAALAEHLPPSTDEGGGRGSRADHSAKRQARGVEAQPASHAPPPGGGPVALLGVGQRLERGPQSGPERSEDQALGAASPELPQPSSGPENRSNPASSGEDQLPIFEPPPTGAGRSTAADAVALWAAADTRPPSPQTLSAEDAGDIFCLLGSLRIGDLLWGGPGADSMTSITAHLPPLPTDENALRSDGVHLPLSTDENALRSDGVHPPLPTDDALRSDTKGPVFEEAPPAPGRVCDARLSGPSSMGEQAVFSPSLASPGFCEDQAGSRGSEPRTEAFSPLLSAAASKAAAAAMRNSAPDEKAACQRVQPSPTLPLDRQEAHGRRHQRDEDDSRPGSVSDTPMPSPPKNRRQVSDFAEPHSPELSPGGSLTRGVESLSIDSVAAPLSSSKRSAGGFDSNAGQASGVAGPRASTSSHRGSGAAALAGASNGEDAELSALRMREMAIENELKRRKEEKK